MIPIGERGLEWIAKYRDDVRPELEPLVHLTVDLQPAQALALAQFLKRVGQDDYSCLAVDVDEAWAMLDAGKRLRTTLATAGYAPR